MSLEDDTYNTIFTALKHPIRRRILRILGQTPTAYTEIQTQLGIDNGLLNYHLENMKDLLTKGDEGKYSLSEFGRAALGVTEKVESPAVGKRNGLSGNKQIGIILILTIAVASLSGLSYQVYNNYVSQGVVLYEKTAELDEATRRLNTLIPFGELANVSEPATYWTDGVSIVNGFPMTVTYRFGGSDGLHDEYYDTTAIIVFYVPVNGSVVRLNLIVDPVNVYDLDLTLQGGNAWRNETLLDLGTVAEYYNRTEINEWTLKHIWQAPIVWSMKTHGNGIIETTPLAKGWYTLSMFGPITFTGSGERSPWPMFKGIFPWGRIGLNGLPIDSYRAYIDLLIMKAGEPSFFAVTTARS